MITRNTEALHETYREGYKQGYEDGIRDFKTFVIDDINRLIYKMENANEQ